MSTEPKRRKPAFEDWPTLKVLFPPTGLNSRNIDEFCVTFCSQTISGRIGDQAASCNTLCIRKVFPHEIRNLAGFYRHAAALTDADGKAKYPLPEAGQTYNVPKIFGGKPSVDPAEAKSNPVKYWDEGWYLWASSSEPAMREHISGMRMTLPVSTSTRKWQESAMERYNEYQLYLTKYGPESGLIAPPEEQAKWPAATLAPPRPYPLIHPGTFLVPFPPNLPLFDRIHKLLEPTHRVLALFDENWSSGAFHTFAGRMREKAVSKEPFVLASRTCSRAYELWKQGPPRDEEEGGKKGSS